MIFVLLFYVVGVLFTRGVIIDGNMPDTNPQPGSPDTVPNLFPSWAIIWPIFWLKTIPIFIELHREEKENTGSVQGKVENKN